MMENDPCTVCGCTDVNLVDGYYYCIECGTQDTNVRETVVEQTIFNETVVATKARKIHKAKVEMSPEWYKWHTYNFVLVGLADEMMALGAGPSFRMKLLWIWSRYIKMYQKKDDNNDEKAKDIEDLFGDSSNSELSDSEEGVSKAKDCPNKVNIQIVTITLFISLIYVALNIDNSEIELMDIYRFIREDKISYNSSRKYIPKEMKVSSIIGWHNFIHSHVRYPSKRYMRSVIMIVFKKLKIGSQSIPNMKNITTRLVKELCLPDAFKQLVFSLMKAVPWTTMIYPSISRPINRAPDFEGVAMAYIVMALKICFGLDDDYEIKLCETVSKMNEDNNFAKAYRFDMYSEETNRLFSFQEWISYLQFRMMTLQQYSLAYATQSNQRWVDDYLVLAQTKYKEWLDETQFKIKDRITLDIINKINIVNPHFGRFKIEFPITLTAMSDHIDTVVNKAEDPDIRLLLSEDFTKYSLKYAAIDFKLKGIHGLNVIEGVDNTNKLLSDNIGIFKAALPKFDSNIVYIRDCQNKNWMTTKQPKTKHILKADIDMSTAKDDNFDESSISDNCDVKDDTTLQEHDYGYNSQEDSDSTCTKDSIDCKLKKEEVELCKGNKLLKEEEGDIVEDDITGNIYDDSFLDVNEYNGSEYGDKNNSYDNVPCTIDMLPPDEDVVDNPNDFDLVTFNREEAIKELVIEACKSYKIPIPKQYKEQVVRKRNIKEHNPEAVEIKRRKITRDEKTDAQNEISVMIENYQQIVLRELVNKHISSSELFRPDIPDNKEVLDAPDLKNDSDCQEAHGPLDMSLGEENKLQEEIDTINDSKNSLFIHNIFENSNNNEEIESVNEDEDEKLQINDPKFDDNVYNPNQLYLKYEHKELAEDSYVDNDPEFEKFLAKVVEEQDLEEQEALKKKKTQITKTKKQKNDKLITNKTLKDFGYWIRHYVNDQLYVNFNCPRKFDKELMMNYPKSFYVVLHHCSMVSSSSMLDIYAYLVKCERYMLGYRTRCNRNNTNV